MFRHGGNVYESVLSVVLFTCLIAFSLTDNPTNSGPDKSGKSGYQEGTVYYNAATGKFTFKRDVVDKDHGFAYGYYNNTLNETGWGVLEITAGCPHGHGVKRVDGNATCTDNQTMYAAGLLEGIFTAEQMWQNYLNLRPFYLEPSDKTVEDRYRWFFNKQDAWTRSKINERTLDNFWNHVGYIMAQFDGLAEGYRQTAGPSWDSGVFVPQFLNAVGDMIDLRHFINPSARPDFKRMTKSQIRSYAHANGHCSALIRVTGAYENLFMSHSSWFLYASTMRIYKHYHFNLIHPATAAKSLSFSSYPGFLESLDDFYMMDSGLVVLQTTNLVFNLSLYDFLTPASLFAWQRVRVANVLSRTAFDWPELLRKENSGTYNNQYMVIDLKRIKLNKEVEDGALVVVEQIPTLVVGEDQSSILRTGYWPSYNVPFYEEVYTLSGYPEVVAKHGSDFSYQLAPRAKIFRRDAGNVHSFQDMMGIMRYNDYKHDSYSEGNACDTICCRGDLVTDRDALASELVSGCYDTKVTDYSLALQLRSLVINGPTTSHNLPAFSWTGRYANQTHVGLPPAYNFDWQPMVPKH